MKTNLHNRKWVCLLVSMALLLVGTASGASWQCLDGKPCPLDCKMQHGGTPNATTSIATAPAHCSHCPSGTAPLQITNPLGRSGLACTTPQCVIRISDHPTSSLQDQAKFYPLALAMPPPIDQVTSPTVIMVLAPTTYLGFYPQRFLRPFLGRGPPTTL